MARSGPVRRTKRSSDEWSALILEQAESGQSQREFCESRALALSSFANAKRRLGQRSRVDSGSAEFVTIPLIQSTVTSWDVELNLGDDVVLRLRRT